MAQLVPTTEVADIVFSLNLIKMHQECFTAVSKAELLRGYLFTDRVLDVFLHVIPEARTKIYGVQIPIGAYQLAHIASGRRGSASIILKQFLEWAGKPTIWLFVKVDNKRAIEFYQRKGFTIESKAVFKNFSSYIMVLK